MTHFQLFAVFAAAIYLSECLVIVGENGWLLLSWGGAFRLFRGPKFQLRNPWPFGFSYRFPPAQPGSGEPPNMSLPEAEGRYKEFLFFDKTLVFWSRLLIGWTIAGFLLFAFRRGFMLAWGVWAFAFLFAHITLVITFWRGFGKLYPGQKWRRIRKTLLCAVSPWLSSRCMDLLADPLFDHFHPLVVGKLLLSEEAFATWARRWLLELKHPPVLSGVADSPLLLEKRREQEEQKLTQWLKEWGLETAQLLTPLGRTGTQDQSYCRRCEVAYQQKEGTCKDCGRDLVPFEGPLSEVG
jgi:hypothetical protein